jgi:hypothetical protein
MTRPFHAIELHGSDVPGVADELEQALDAARLIEGVLTPDEILPSAGFSNDVMAAVASSAAPSRNRVLVLVGALRATWRTALSAGQPRRVRARALAVVLATLIVLGSVGGAAAFAAAGALRFITPPPSVPVPTLVPRPSPHTGPTERATPGEKAEPSEGVEPSETPERSEPSEPEASDDGGGGDDDGGSGGGLGSPRQSKLPGPGATPRLSSSPEPSDD